MNVRRIRMPLVASAAILGPTTAAVPASAQWIVFDPHNYSQNILTAARELQQVNQNIQCLETRRRPDEGEHGGADKERLAPEDLGRVHGDEDQRRRMHGDQVQKSRGVTVE